MIGYLIAVVILIGLSAFFSASEMAFNSANRVRLENARDDGSSGARIACIVCDHYDDALSAVLIGNMLVNFGSSSLAGVIAITLAERSGTAFAADVYPTIGAIVMTILVIIFGETMPKIVAKKNANRFAISVAWIIRALTVVLKPLILVVVWLIRLLTRPMAGPSQEKEQEAAAQELQSIIETVEDEGVIDEERSELLQAALDFSEISASEVMTARVDMVALDIDDDWEDMLAAIESAPYSRLPVYEDSVDNIIGILYLNHFFKALVDNERVDVRSLLMEPCYVYKTVKLPAVLSELRKCKQHLAIVTDEYGGSMGVVTMEDVLEELVGDIWDETDEVDPEVVERSEGLYELDGDLPISDFLELLEWDEDSFDTESATVGGWTIESFGGFPKEGDSFSHENLRVTVLTMDGLRVEKVLIRVEPPKED